MSAICNSFGIRFFAVFQPCILSKNVLNPLEKHYFHNDYSVFAESRSKIYRMILKEIEKNEWLYDFSGIFNNNSDDLYFDLCHLYTKGNRILAKEILKLIVPSIQQIVSQR